MRMVDQGVTKLTWIPGESAIVDHNAPSAAELNAVAAVDLSCIMVSTYEVRADGSDTTNERAVCETAETITPTIQKYMGNLVLFRDIVAGVPGPDDLTEVFPQSGATGWFVRRTGKSYDLPYVDGDVVETFKFLNDVPQLSGGTGEGYLKGTVPLLAQGRFAVAATVGGESSSS
jgi:hypothetical protein